MNDFRFSKKLIVPGLIFSMAAWMILAIDYFKPVQASGVEDLGPGFDLFITFVVFKALATVFLFVGGAIFFKKEFSYRKKSDLIWGFLTIFSAVDVGILVLIFYMNA